MEKYAFVWFKMLLKSDRRFSEIIFWGTLFLNTLTITLLIVVHSYFYILFSSTEWNTVSTSGDE